MSYNIQIDKEQSSSSISTDDNVSVVSKNCINISDDTVLSTSSPNSLDDYMRLPMERLETIPFARGTKLGIIIIIIINVNILISIIINNHDHH